MALYHKKKVFDQKLFCVKFLVKILFLYITVKLDFDIDRKFANFDFKNPQNISVDQIITELSTFSFHYELVMNFSWNPKDSHNRYELYIAWWNRTPNTRRIQKPHRKQNFPITQKAVQSTKMGHFLPFI